MRISKSICVNYKIYQEVIKLKRKIALFVTLFILVTVLIPSQVFAEGDKGLQEAIKAAKGKLSIPDSFTEFNYNVITEDDRQVWYLSWNSKNGNDGSISVRIDDQGTILSYYYYRPYDYNQRKLPAVSRQEAKVKAEEFIKKINPDALSQVKLVDNHQQNSLMEVAYYFNFIRMVNGIPFDANNIFVEVNRETGDVQGYQYNWLKNLAFPAADKAISLEEAQKAYKEKLGLRLIYDYTVDSDMVKAYAAYAPKYNSNYCIDAFTGEKINISPIYYYADGRGGAEYNMKRKMASEAKAEQPALSPEELKAVEEISKLLSKEDAERKTRSYKILELTDDFKLNNANLSRDWPLKKDFTWYLHFVKEPKDKNDEYQYLSVRLDARTGEIRGFYRNTSYKDGDAAKFDEAASKAAVEKFLKELYPDRFSTVEYDESDRNYYILYNANEKLPQYNFRYIRKVDGVLFPNNSMTVSYDAVNGKIISFDMTWFDLDFPSVDKAVSLDHVYEKMFKEIGLELQYKVTYTDELTSKIVPPDYSNRKTEVKLVYSVKQDKPLLFDANTGIILDYDGKPYKENKPVEYTDISGSFAEKQIIALAEYGIALEGTEFKPDQEVSQKDFFRLLSKTLNYYGPYPASNGSNKDIDEMYSFLIREGIVKENEKSPDSTLTREDSVKFIIRALKYDKVADIKGIYYCNFKDADKINADLIGYVVIANGLKIINGNNGYFNPKDKLTRAEAAVMIYNYLQR